MGVFFVAGVDPYLFPARGRKHRQSFLQLTLQIARLIPTFSPQGDGNNSVT